MRRTAVTLVCLAAVFPGVAKAADPIKSALAVIPGEAIGFVCVPSIKQLDSEWQQAVTNLGLQPFVQPPYNSPLALMQMFGQMTAGLDANGPLVFVQMPFENPFEQSAHAAIVLPAEDPKALIEAMGGQAGEGGVWSVPLFGMPMSAATGDKRVVLAQLPDVLKAVTDSKKSMVTKFKAKDLEMFKGLNLVLWLDGEKLLNTFKPQIDGFVGMITMMQAASGPAGAKQAESFKKQVDMFVDGAQAVLIGVSLDPAGVGLRFALDTKPGSELAKQMKVKPAAGSLLQGLPAGKFMIAGGQVYTADQMKEMVKQFDPYFEMGDVVETIDADQLRILKNIFEDWAPTIRGWHLSLEALPPGPSGVIGLSMLFDTSDSGRWLDSAGKAVNALKKLSTDEDAQMIASAVSYTEGAEEIAGKKVAHLKIDLAKIEQIEEEDVEEITAVLGEEGVLFRMAAVGSDTVALSFGGGASYMNRLIEHADQGAAPLDNSPGISKVAGHLSENRVSEAYIAVDQIVACIGNVAKVLEDDEEFPFRMPKIDAPLAISSTVTEGVMQMDMFFPTELVVAGKDLILTVVGSGAIGGPGGPGGEVTIENVPDNQEG